MLPQTTGAGDGRNRAKRSSDTRFDDQPPEADRPLPPPLRRDVRADVRRLRRRRLEHGLMMPAMLVPMFFRLDLYTGRAGHTARRTVRGKGER
jgi:hypothetical protein